MDWSGEQLLIVLLQSIVQCIMGLGKFFAGSCKIIFNSVDIDLINSLGPSAAIWWQRSGSTLAQVIACCLMAPSYYVNQCWLIINKQGCQPVRNFRILYGFYMQNTGVRIWPRKYGNWALSVLSLKVLLPEQSLPVLGSKSVRICGILCLRTFKYLFNHQNIQSSLFHM